MGGRSSLLIYGDGGCISETTSSISEMLNDISLAWLFPGPLKIIILVIKAPYVLITVINIEYAISYLLPSASLCDRHPYYHHYFTDK